MGILAVLWLKLDPQVFPHEQMILIFPHLLIQGFMLLVQSKNC